MVNRKSLVLVGGFATALVLIWLINNDLNHLPDRVVESLALDGLFRGELAGHQFTQATEVRKIEFPEDHGPHFEFQTEWWYFTGNLTSTDNQQFGFQFTIFRRAMSASQVEVDSDWSGNQIYLSHIAITDIGRNEFLIDEVYSRDALELAGATAQPFAIWVENWTVKAASGRCEGCLDLHIKADSDSFSMDLQLNSKKPAVLQGDRGLSHKGSLPGNASYYYSLTHLETSGSITVYGQSSDVVGLSWMDHEWFTSLFEEEVDGWDWFALQLDDRRELTLFQVRQGNNSDEFFKYGVLIDAQGNSQKLAPEKILLKQVRFWQSAESEARYPVGWGIEIPELGMELIIEAAVDHQERIDSFRYWEGAVIINGSDGANPVSGKGYLEMTGY